MLNSKAELIIPHYSIGVFLQVFIHYGGFYRQVLNGYGFEIKTVSGCNPCFYNGTGSYRVTIIVF